MQSNIPLYSTVYPMYKNVAAGISQLPISSRSVLIKLCQAQIIPDSDSTLGTLLDNLPPHTPPHGRYKTSIPIREYLHQLQFDPSDPVHAAILLDICRGVEADPMDIEKTRTQSWMKEIHLAQGTFRTDPINWQVIFSEDDSDRNLPLHPLLEPNPTMARYIHITLRHLRLKLQGTTFFSRYTHKNMSNSTRRDYQSVTKDDLQGVPIFGQDDLLRMYHRTGYFLQGDVEMRQRWYTSGAKPRTYFAMGGTTYQYSRFLQDFFTKIVDSLPMTNHKTRLRPSRLVLPISDDDEVFHWRIYDLSSFTSNCCIQRSLCYALSGFFEGCEVVCLDERVGPIARDLGEMLYEYTKICVEEPSLSLERFDPSLVDYPLRHEVASMLGIFGNLMSCTFAHSAVVSQVVADPTMYNCAGDDGLAPESMETEGLLDDAVTIVGVYERTKSFRGNEEGAICLKRPFIETYPSPTLHEFIIPPTVATAITVLTEYRDPRYPTFEDYSEWRDVDRISVIGKDLLRFLRSAYRFQYQDVALLGSIVMGFSKLVRRHIGRFPRPGCGGPDQEVWPLNPVEYEFSHVDPTKLLFLYFSNSRIVPRKEIIDGYPGFFFEGDQFEANSCKFLKLLEMLGYVRKEEVSFELAESDRLTYYDDVILCSKPLPGVYNYTVVQDVPQYFCV